ncbi:hypothetical protein FB451DRAFT_275356 [Mycena latifolia]|nr:hypothetical protein FB451DRAFT_275356 [Mycena latifolia]
MISRLSTVQKSDITLFAHDRRVGFPEIPHSSDASSFLEFTMGIMDAAVPPEAVIPTVRHGLAQREARRAGRIIREWPDYPQDDADDFIDHSISTLMDWRLKVRSRTRFALDMGNNPIPGIFLEDSILRLQLYGLYQEIKDIAALEDALENWRKDLIEEWHRQETQVIYDFQQPKSLRRTLRENSGPRLLREARIVFILGVLAATWKSQAPHLRHNFWEGQMKLEQALGEILHRQKTFMEGLTVAEIIEQWKKGDRKAKWIQWNPSHPSNTEPANASTPGALTTRREEIQAQWNKAAREAGAAQIEFVNEIDNEELPPNIGGLFVYLERSYRFEVAVNPKITTPSGCHCEGGALCTTRTCHHKPDAAVRSEYNRRLFDFGVDSHVRECNSLCSCLADCANRIAQQPRSIAIQIFKTEKCGWGARAAVNIKKGTVVGIYTGLIIRRHDAVNLSSFRVSYCFDLNALEDPDGETPENSYTVDAFACGNWTRFINHSCEPNLKAIPVMYDTMPEDNLPYLAFVATRSISAYTELTFDYNPFHQREWEMKKYKDSRKGDDEEKSEEEPTPLPVRCRKLSWVVVSAKGVKRKSALVQFKSLYRDAGIMAPQGTKPGSVGCVPSHNCEC